MKKYIKSILGLSALSVCIILASTGCQKEQATQPVSPTSGFENNNGIPGLQLISLVTTCPSTCVDRLDTVRSEWIDSSIVGIPSSWATSTRYYNLSTGVVPSSSSYHFSLSGQFLSRITSGATLGIYDSTNVPPSGFASIDCGDTAYFSTTGVVSNSLANYRNVDTVGWYYYNFMNPFLVNPARVVGIKFTCGYYAIWLQVFVTSRLYEDEEGTRRQYQANVVVRTKCLTGC